MSSAEIPRKTSSTASKARSLAMSPDHSSGSPKLHNTVVRSKDGLDGDNSDNENTEGEIVTKEEEEKENIGTVNEDIKQKRTGVVKPLSKAKYKPYVPPPIFFIYVLDKDGKTILANTRCKKGTFLDYLKRNLNLDSILRKSRTNDRYNTAIDFININDNKITALRHLDKQAYLDVEQVFVGGETYIPCCVVTDDQGYIKNIVPVLEDIELNHPAIVAAIEQTKFQEAERFKKTMDFITRLERIAKMNAEKAEKEREEEETRKRLELEKEAARKKKIDLIY